MKLGLVLALLIVSGSCGGDEDPPRARRAMTVCDTWRVATTVSEGVFSGDVLNCEKGDYSAAGRAATLARVNALRSFAGVQRVIESSEYTLLAQSCALMMDAENALSHVPTSLWDCYSPSGATAAGRSNISTRDSISSVLAYMTDSGVNNWGSLGHRRWILYSALEQVGVGSTDDYSCLWVVPANIPPLIPLEPAVDWVAWPPPGKVPFAALDDGALDSTGWSIQSSSLNLSNAQVEVSRNGVNLPVRERALVEGAGDYFAVGFVPIGWSTQAGQTYHVSARVIRSAFPEDDVIIEYDVDVQDCP